jgi:hypothetical protein
LTVCELMRFSKAVQSITSFPTNCRQYLIHGLVCSSWFLVCTLHLAYLSLHNFPWARRMSLWTVNSTITQTWFVGKIQIGSQFLRSMLARGLPLYHWKCGKVDRINLLRSEIFFTKLKP